MAAKQPVMKPLKLSDVEVLRLYGDASSEIALALKVGKPGVPG